MDILSTQEIEYYQNNKHEITQELLEVLRKHGNKGKQLALQILQTQKDHEGYFLDAYDNRISRDGNRMLKKEYTKMTLNEIHKKEILRCKQDIFYFMNNYVKITTPKGIDFPELRTYQREFIECILPDENESIVGLLPRQSGKSVTIAIYLAHKFLFNSSMNIGIAANKGTMAKEFLDKTKNILLLLPMWLQQGIKVWNKTWIEAENGMRILTDSTTGDSFRGYTIHLVVVDECAFIRGSQWDEFTDAIFPSQSGLAWKKNILISTANGRNHFYDIVQGAKEIIKNPDPDNPDWNGYTFYEAHWQDVPRYKPDGTLMSNEDFQDSVVKKYGTVYFEQNFGNNFLGSSYTLITAETLRNVKPKKPIDVWDGELKIYELPKKNHHYIMAVDPSKDGIDGFAVQIVDITNFKFKQVASCSMQVDYLSTPAFIYEWAANYFNPYIIIENNEGAGQSVADILKREYEYENLHYDKTTGTSSSYPRKKRYPGTRTTAKSRRQILQTLKKFMESNILKVQCKETLDELYSFVLHKNKYQAEEGAHDDYVMALALVFTIFNSVQNFDDMREIQKLLNDTKDRDNTDVRVSDLITVGIFDDGSEYEDYPEGYRAPDTLDSEDYHEFQEYLS